MIYENPPGKATKTADEAPLIEKSLGGALFFCSKTGNSPQIRYGKYSTVNKMSRFVAKMWKSMDFGVDFAPYRGYNEITVKGNTKTVTQNGARIKQNATVQSE